MSCWGDGFALAIFASIYHGRLTMHTSLPIINPLLIILEKRLSIKELNLWLYDKFLKWESIPAQCYSIGGGWCVHMWVHMHLHSPCHTPVQLLILLCSPSMHVVNSLSLLLSCCYMVLYYTITTSNMYTHASTRILVHVSTLALCTTCALEVN